MQRVQIVRPCRYCACKSVFAYLTTFSFLRLGPVQQCSRRAFDCRAGHLACSAHNAVRAARAAAAADAAELSVRDRVGVAPAGGRACGPTGVQRAARGTARGRRTTGVRDVRRLALHLRAFWPARTCGQVQVRTPGHLLD